MARNNNDGPAGGADPSKLPAHLRPMMGGGGSSSAPAGKSADTATEGDGTPPAPSGDGFSLGHFLKNWWFLVIAMPLILWVRFTIFSPFKIPSGSMEPELLGNEDTGDRVVVDLRAYKNTDPQRWDIAVFKSPKLKARANTREEGTEDIDYVKRCVGLAGDRIVISGGDLYNIHVDKDGKESFEILRKPLDLQRELWHTLYSFPYDFPWEAPDPLIRHGEWEVAPETACTPAADKKSFHLASKDGGTWTLTMRRTQTALLGFGPPVVVTPPLPTELPATPAPATPAPETPVGPQKPADSTVPGAAPLGPMLPALPTPPAPPAPPAAPVGPISPVGPVRPVAPEALAPAPAPVPAPLPAGPVAPTTGTAAADAGPPRVTVSMLSNRYLKTGDYWFRIPNTHLMAWRAHVRGSETVLQVPEDITPEGGAKPGVIDPEVKLWHGKRIYPIPLTWYAGNAEIESTPPQTETERNIELWRLTAGEADAYRQMNAEDQADYEQKMGRIHKGTSLRIGEGYGENFGANDLRIELGLDVKTWGTAFTIQVDGELAADGRQVLRRYGLRVEHGAVQPYVEALDVKTGAFLPVTPETVSGSRTPGSANAGGVNGASAAGLALPATGKVHLALEHFDGIIRVVLYDSQTGAETATTGFQYTPSPRAMKQYSAGLHLSGEGSDVVFEKLKISRDLYYLWDEFKLMEEGGVMGNLQYRTSNANFPQMPDGFLVHRADGLTEFDLKPESFPGDPKSWFLMCGDNTVSSVDARYFGPVERWRFSGKYWFTFWPPSRAMAVR